MIVRSRELEHPFAHVREPAAHEPEPGHLSRLEPASAHAAVSHSTVSLADSASSGVGEPLHCSHRGRIRSQMARLFTDLAKHNLRVDSHS